MKKIFWGVLSAALLTASLAGCASKPSETEILSALESGTLTTEDAMDKGYVTNEWVSEYLEETSIPASDKLSVNLMGAFKTKDKNGAEFSFAPSEMPILFLFADPENSESLANIQRTETAYGDIQSAGGDVVLVLLGEDVPEALTDSQLPTIFYNEDIKNQLGSNQDMIDGNAFSASWNIKGSFITAWYRTLEKDNLPQTVTDLLNTFAQKSTDETERDAGAPVPAGTVG